MWETERQEWERERKRERQGWKSGRSVRERDRSERKG